MVEKVGAPSGKGSELGSTDKGSHGKLTACYKVVGLVERVDLWYFVELQMKKLTNILREHSCISATLLARINSYKSVKICVNS